MKTLLTAIITLSTIAIFGQSKPKAYLFGSVNHGKAFSGGMDFIFPSKTIARFGIGAEYGNMHPDLLAKPLIFGDIRGQFPLKNGSSAFVSARPGYMVYSAREIDARGGFSGALLLGMEGKEKIAGFGAAGLRMVSLEANGIGATYNTIVIQAGIRF